MNAIKLLLLISFTVASVLGMEKEENNGSPGKNISSGMFTLKNESSSLDKSYSLYKKIPIYYPSAIAIGCLSKDFFPVNAKGFLGCSTVLGAVLAFKYWNKIWSTESAAAKGKPINVTWFTAGIQGTGWLIAALAANGAINYASKIQWANTLFKNIIIPMFFRRH